METISLTRLPSRRVFMSLLLLLPFTSAQARAAQTVFQRGPLPVGASGVVHRSLGQMCAAKCVQMCSLSDEKGCRGVFLDDVSSECFLLTWVEAAAVSFLAAESAPPPERMDIDGSLIFRREACRGKECAVFQGFHFVQIDDHYHEFCMAFFHTAAPFDAADKLCASQGARLPRMDSMRKMEVLRRFVDDRVTTYSAIRFWAGVRKDEGSESQHYHTLDNGTISRASSLWAVGQPGGARGAACGFVFTDSWRLHSSSCGRDNVLVLCEVELA